MSADTIKAEVADRDERWLHRVGGVSALALGTAYVVIFPLYARVGAPPSGDGAAWLEYLAGKTTVWWAILALSVLTDLLFVPLALSLYFALRRVHRGAMLLATAFIGLFVVLDLAVTWTAYGSLLTLSAQHAAATTEAQRAGFVAAAHHASALLTSRLFVVYAIVVLSSAIFMIGFVMLKAVFTRTTAYLGLLTGVFGIASIAGSGVTIILNAVLATVWILLVGFRLNRLARRPAGADPGGPLASRQ